MQPDIIFDMDGVLVDSEPFHKKIWKEVFNQLDLPFSETYHHTLTGTTGLFAWKKVIEDFQLSDTPERLINFHKEIFYKELENHDLKALPGVISLLKNLRANEFAMSLGSSSPKKLINIVVERLGIQNYFDYLVSGDEVENSKPAPDIFLKIAERYEQPVENFIVIEDSKNGVAAAKNAGMKCVGYVNENSGNQDLSMADLIIESFDELNGQILKTL